jgi:hypothetical protein
LLSPADERKLLVIWLQPKPKCELCKRDANIRGIFCEEHQQEYDRFMESLDAEKNARILRS